MRIPLRGVTVVPIAVCALVVTGCSSTVEGTATAAAETACAAVAAQAASGASRSTDCDALTEALGSLVGGRAEVIEQTVPGVDAPMCVWTKRGINLGGALTMIVKDEPHDRAVIEQMRTMDAALPDPRADALGAVALDVGGFAVMTATHNIVANSLDPTVDDGRKLDMAFAVAEYLAE